MTPDELPRRAVLWFHGFNVDKETHRAELERFARAGFLAVGVDAAGLGERRMPHDGSKQAMLAFADATAAEVPLLVDALLRDGIPTVAIAGVSMGGYIVYRAALLEPRLSAAVAILGSPEGLDFSAFAHVPLLSITAERDKNVPPAPARALHTPHGNPATNYIELPGAQHLLTAEEWAPAVGAAIRFCGGR